MSKDLSSARRQLSTIKSALRQGKLLPAVQAVRSSLQAVIGQPLMKAERDEFERLFSDALVALNANPYLRKIYPIELMYTPGQEKALAGDITELLSMLHDEALAEAEQAATAIAVKKAAALQQGQEHLDAQNFDAARATFKNISDEHPDDSDLKADIGDRVFKAGLHEDAATYLAEAIEIEPESLHYYNRLGIVLRKLGRFETGESYFKKALTIAPDNPILHFNFGRLYLEWNKIDKAMEHGEIAHQLDPNFDEARKLAAYCKQKLPK